MKLFSISFFCFTFFSLHSFAGEMNFIFMGGGGEPNGATTIFDSTVEKMKTYYSSRSFNDSVITFNGGHSNTERLLTQSFPQKQNKPFTSENYESTIRKYIDDLKNNKIKAGDQLLVYLDTHGAMKGKIKGKDELSHSIATTGSAISNYNHLTGTTVVSMDLLKELADAAKDAKVNLGIIDQSCHSGNSISLANEFTCVISSTGSENYGYAGAGTFSDHFIENMKPGKTLEDVFMESRSNASDNGYPLISTDESQEIIGEVYKRISPYLNFYYDTKADKLTKYFKESISDEAFCKRENQFTELNKFLENIEKIFTVKKSFLFAKWEDKKIDLTSLKDALKNYKKSQDDMILIQRKLNNPKFNQEIEVDGDTLTLRELLSTNYKGKIKDNEDIINRSTTDESYKQHLRNENTRLELARNLKTQKAQEFPELQSLTDTEDEFRRNSYSNSNAVAAAEKKFYQSYYEELKKKNPTKPSPCRNFKL